MSKGVCLAILLVSLGGCGGDDVNDGSAAGTGGAAGFPATAGTGAGASGAAGAGGTAGVPGTAGMTGTAGMAGAAGTAGTGAAGMGGAEFAGCEAADASVSGSAAHAAAVELLAADSPCGFSACHAGASGKAMLALAMTTDLRTLLVGHPSCQAPDVPLVADGGGQAALDNSWLWLKLTAPADASGVIASNPAWGTAMNCGQLGNQPFGIRMPWSNTDMPLEASRLAAVRNWICAGAPGP